MLKIKATVKVINRVKVVCPDDGVHVVGKDGFIKGVHSLMFDDRMVPKGATAFYWRLDENIGLRVSYSFGWFSAAKEKVVKRDYKLMKLCYQKGISPKPCGMEIVDLDLFYDYKEGKKIRCLANAIRVWHVHYPEEAWAKYAKGHPYDWTADSHPEHSPEGYKRFVEYARPLARAIDTSWKIGDVVWCTKKKRWYLVDCGQ